jgi:hypothetical protein
MGRLARWLRYPTSAIAFRRCRAASPVGRRAWEHRLIQSRQDAPLMLVLLLPGLAAARRVAQSGDQTWPVRSRALGTGSSAPIPAVRKADRTEIDPE